MSTLTSSNSVFALAIANLYPTPQTVQGYATDSAFTTAVVSDAQVQMGIDGRMSANFVHVPVVQTINLMPDSASFQMFQNWALSQRAAQDIFYASATIILPSIGSKYTLQRGVLTSSAVMPDVKTFLQPGAFVITWQNIIREDYKG